MSQGTFHVPVMVEEVLDLVRPCPPGVIVDATVGGGGHAAAILDDRRDVVVVGIDQDDEAISAATERLAAFGGARSFAGDALTNLTRSSQRCRDRVLPRTAGYRRSCSISE